MIELLRLSKEYENVKAVDQVHLHIEKGELFGFIGPNGAGKTTTIKMITGLLIPTEGKVLIDGIDMALSPEKAKQIIGFIPDRPYIYEKLTGMEFLAFVSDLYSVERSLFLSESQRLLKKFAIDHVAHELIESYSHGMKQRLIICSALIHHPKVIIVDEPMVGLDPPTIILVKTLFRELAMSGTTIFMSTHTLTVAEDLCNRIGIIKEGKLIFVGTVPDLRKKVNMNEGSLEEALMRFLEYS